MATAVGVDRVPSGVDQNYKYVLLLGSLTATVTYTAGLSPPGGIWSSDSGTEYHAGDPVLRYMYPRRYLVFFYGNATAFLASVVVVVLLLQRNMLVGNHGIRRCTLGAAMTLCLFGLLSAFAAGSCRRVRNYIYAVLVAAVLSFIVIKLLVLLYKPVENMIRDVQEALERYLQFLRLEQQSGASEHANDDAYHILRESRMYLLLLGILAASVTYEAGLNPPGGIWQGNAADGHHYLASDPILHITYPRRYLVFFYCNSTAFVASLVILIFLLDGILSSTQTIKYCALQGAMIVDLFGLIGAYAAGSCRQVSKSVYVSVIVIPVFLYIGIHVVVFMINVFPSCTAWREAAREKMKRCTPGWLKEVCELHAERGEEAAAMERKLDKRRRLLLLLAILATSLTYQAGMSPPGGFWQENKSGNVVGNPVVNDNYRRRYLAFFYCNATAFVTSLAIIVLLVNRKLSARGIRWCALRVCIILDLVGLMGAFAAGCCRKISMIDVLFLFLAVIVYISLQVACPLFVYGTARGLVQRIVPEVGWPQVLGVEDEYGSEPEEDELEIGIAGGTTKEEPLGLEISTPIIGGALTVILAIPVMAIVDSPLKLLVAMVIASIGVGIWRRSFARLLWALARPLRRRCIPNHGAGSGTASSSTPREQLVSALCHGACKVIHSLCSGTWMLILVLVIWMPSLRQNLKVKFKLSKITAVLGVLLVSAAAAPTTAITIMDAPSAATSGTLTPSEAPPGTSTARRRRDRPLLQVEIEPTRPRRNRRPNGQLIGGDWDNS